MHENGETLMSHHAQQACEVFGKMVESPQLLKDEKASLYKGLLHLANAMFDMSRQIEKIENDVSTIRTRT